VFFASSNGNLVFFKGEDYERTHRSCFDYALSPFSSEDPPYQAECGVSNVVYPPCGLTTASIRINEMRPHTFVFGNHIISIGGPWFRDIAISLRTYGAVLYRNG
jgi:hypothetical protein